MIIAYLRSSSIGAWKMCEFQYFMQYILGIKSPGNKKADLGNMVHKALELLARRRQSEQRGLTTLFDPESKSTLNVVDITIPRAIRLGWDAYKHLHPFTPEDYRTVTSMVESVCDGLYSPLRQEIVEPEQFFDLEIPGDWAELDFTDPHTGEAVKGRLSIKGAMDLIVRDGPGAISYIDWKTGARKDWATGKIKDYDALMHDPQLLLYYYAIRRLYPNDIVTMNIYFTKEGGPFTLPYGDAEYELAEQMLREFFEEIRDKSPSRIMGTDRSGPCFSFCHFGKTYADNGKRLCNHYWNELQTLGMDRVIATHGKPGHSYKYGGGGGVTARDPI